MTRDIIEVSRPWVAGFACQLCGPTDSTDADLLAVANRDNPTGTHGSWMRVVREGEGEPVPCERDSGRSHFLVEC